MSVVEKCSKDYGQSELCRGVGGIRLCTVAVSLVSYIANADFIML